MTVETGMSVTVDEKLR